MFLAGNSFNVEIVIMVDDIDAYYEKVKSFVNIVEPLVLQLGYYLRFCPKHDILDFKSSPTSQTSL